MELDPAFDADLDEIFDRESATPHQSFQQAEIYHAFNHWDFASPNVFPEEGCQNFLAQDGLASYDLFQPGLQGNALDQEDFPVIENLLQPQIDSNFQRDQMTFVVTPSQALFYGNNCQQDFHGTGILQSTGHAYMPESLRSNLVSNQANLQYSIQQVDPTTSLENIEQLCVDPVSVANHSHDPEKSGRGYSHGGWEAKKDVLHRIWVEENCTMSVLMETMTEVYGFTASANAYRSRFNKWGFPPKNRTKANVGVAILSDDDKNSIRERTAQALSKQRGRKGGVAWTFVKDSVPKVLADKTYKYHGDMINHLEKLAKGLFDKGNKNCWSYNEFTLVPPPGAKDTSMSWQLLTHQCYSASTLAECGPSSRVNPSLQRLFQGLHHAAKICDPNVLIYFWNVCTSLNRIRISGEPKIQGYPLLRLLLAVLENSFSNSCKSSERTHSMIDFLRSLSFILKEDPKGIRKTLEMGYKKFIHTIGDVIGHDHAIVLNMVSHYAKYYNAHIVDKVGPKSILERYKQLIGVEEKTRGSSEEQKIALLYDYIRAASHQCQQDGQACCSLKRDVSARPQKPNQSRDSKISYVSFIIFFFVTLFVLIHVGLEVGRARHLENKGGSTMCSTIGYG